MTEFLIWPLAKYSPDASELLYWAYFGGSARDAVTGVAVDGAGAIYFAGYTYSNDIPLVNPVQPFRGGRLPRAAAGASRLAMIGGGAIGGLLGIAILSGGPR